MRYGMRALLLAALTAVLLGCTGASPVRPPAALATALDHPDVAAWYAAHSAPTVLEEMPRWQAQAWFRYKPATSVDLVWQGLLVRFDSEFGAQPRRLEVTVNRQTGEVVEVQLQNR